MKRGVGWEGLRINVFRKGMGIGKMEDGTMMGKLNGGIPPTSAIG